MCPLWLNPKQRGHDAPAFSRQEIESPAGGAGIHDLEPDLPDIKGFADFIRRMCEYLAAAEYHDLRIVFEHRLQVRFFQRVYPVRQPVFNDRLRRDYNVCCISHAGYSYRAGRIGVYFMFALIDICFNFHNSGAVKTGEP